MLLNYFKIEDFKLTNFFKRLYAKYLEEDILSSAAQVAFYFSFALFPLLLFLLSLLGMILGSADDLRTELFYYLRQVMPYSAYDLVQTTIQQVTESTSGSKLTLGLFIALWSASAGIDSIRIALNSVFNLDEKRAWWKTKLTSLLQTLAIAILVSCALGFVFYGWKFVSLALGTIGLTIPSPFILIIIQILSVLILLMLVFALIYNFSPDYKSHNWVWVTPGAITGIVLWVLFSEGFRLYLHYFNSYNKTYGSLGAVIILLLWLYLTALVVLIGGLINATLQEMSDPQTAAAGEKGIGENKEKNKEDSSDSTSVETTADKAAEIRAELKADESSDLTTKLNTEPVKTTNRPPDLTPENLQLEKISNDQKAEYHLSPSKSRNTSWINLAVPTAFGFLMGMFFKRKKP